MRLTLVLVFGFYAVMFPCICAQATHAPAEPSACCHDAKASKSAEGAVWTSHHQCCGMQRAPIAIERIPAADSPSLEISMASPTAAIVPDPHHATRIVPNFFHGPPFQALIYLVTQHFVI